eukprot:gnl/TRDRNA2_/TRDRNA2_90402_c0_seq1.p1 gnl/TRDRNA2_/TRDRNA2_90402_c0~~gnl/TRDRNA2_/TRDRNA2_90402_c0_seq1.p1  ORF type:complete len:307 (+),score=37.54 gnl/TRDRNA2_/TRDRNA2_90402_c0_seq1:85-1005(+)
MESRRSLLKPSAALTELLLQETVPCNTYCGRRAFTSEVSVVFVLGCMLLCCLPWPSANRVGLAVQDPANNSILFSFNLHGKHLQPRMQSLDRSNMKTATRAHGHDSSHTSWGIGGAALVQGDDGRGFGSQRASTASTSCEPCVQYREDAEIRTVGHDRGIVESYNFMTSSSASEALMAGFEGRSFGFTQSDSDVEHNFVHSRRLRKAKPTKHSAGQLADRIFESTVNRGGGAAGALDRAGGKAGHAKYKCPVCAMAAPDPKSASMHWESKHDKAGPFAIDSWTDAHAAQGGVTTAGVAVRGSTKKL